MSVLILAEHNNKRLESSTRNLLTAAAQLSTDITVLIAGFDCRQVAEEAATLQGVHSVLYVDAQAYQYPTPEMLSKLIVDVAKDCQYILGPSSTFGKNTLPRVAALFDVTQISDVITILDKQTFERPIYAGNAIETVQVLDQRMVMTIRPTAFEARIEKQTPCCIEQLTPNLPTSSVRVIKQELGRSERPDLGSAKTIVSGGRGLQSGEKFKLIEELADVLGAAVGASRAAVDAGFVPNEYQVGQTGRIVAPTLYIAIGISGAVQHLAGMKDSKVIVAINKDADAPIFQIATYGLVGDLFELVPQLIQELKSK